MLFRFIFIGLCLLVLPSAASAVVQDASAFHKGINLSSWLANAPRQPLYERDFVQLKHAGFDHIRLPVNPEQMGFTLEGGSLAHIDFRPLDNAIGLAIKSGLNVILDIHPSHNFMKTLEEKDSAEQAFASLWIALTTRYQRYPASQLAFELLNEPQYYHAEARYSHLVLNLIQAIRRADNTRTLVIAAPHGSSIDALQYLEPVTDAHVIYDFHFYEPYLVTHQSATWGFEKKMIRYFHDVPYPSDRVTHDARFYAENATSAAQAQSELDEYSHAAWNAEHIAARIKIAKAWALKNNVNLICGEFGVLRNRIAPESRYRWIRDTRTALEANGFGWELWDYTDVFGITTLTGETRANPNDGSVRLVDPEKGSRTIEPQALSALGLESF